MYIETMSDIVDHTELKYDKNNIVLEKQNKQATIKLICRQDTFLIYSLLTSSQGILPLGENIEAFQRAPLATITDEAPGKDTKHYQITNNWRRQAAVSKLKCKILGEKYFLQISHLPTCSSFDASKIFIFKDIPICYNWNWQCCYNISNFTPLSRVSWPICNSPITQLSVQLLFKNLKKRSNILKIWN